MEKTILLCPKCKSDHLLIIELWANASIEWEQINGEIDQKNGSLNEGNPYRLECFCKKCAHKWKVRKHWQITHVIV